MLWHMKELVHSAKACATTGLKTRSDILSTPRQQSWTRHSWNLI
jgi:hypothetical protein